MKRLQAMPIVDEEEENSCLEGVDASMTLVYEPEVRLFTCNARVY